MKTNHFLQLFWLDALLHILAIIFQLEWLVIATKPLLMVFLALYFYRGITATDYKNWILLALFFSFGGDVFLMFHVNRELLFILGLGSFLIAHLYYSYGMLQFPNFKSGILHKKIWLALPLIAYSIGLIYLVLPKLGDLAVPVMVYAFVIMLTGLSAINLFGRMSSRNASLVTLGAILFILSDSVIALDKFLATQLYIPNPRLIIMVTYILGQFLIVQGFINDNQSER